jgi:hypothetical protein
MGIAVEGASVPAPDAAAIEAAVAVVPGVTRAVVTFGADGEPEVLRVVLGDEADPLGVARAAHRILRLQFGVGLDPGRIEIVEDVPLVESRSVLRLVEEDEHGALLLGEDVQALLDDLDPGPGPRFGTEVLASAARHPAGVGHEGSPTTPARQLHGERVAVARLALSADGLGVTATVTLTHDGVEHSGSAEGPTTPAALHRCVASATLRALAPSLTSTAVRLDVDAVAIVPVGDSSAAVVRVIWLTPDGAEHLTGASEVRDDPRYAVIRATLDAVNRRLIHDVEA